MDPGKTFQDHKRDRRKCDRVHEEDHRYSKDAVMGENKKTRYVRNGIKCKEEGGVAGSSHGARQDIVEKQDVLDQTYNG